MAVLMRKVRASQCSKTLLMTFSNSAPKKAFSVLFFGDRAALVGVKEEQIFFSWQTSF